MDSNYVFLCGVMWCRFGQKDAGKELLRAADSWGSRYGSTGLDDVCERSPSLERVEKTDATFFPRDPWGGAMWMRSCAACKALLHKLMLCDSVRCQCGWIW
jgi:hypothetical protein